MDSERGEPPQRKHEAPGAQLKAQREAMGWSIEQVADQLKLAPRQVVALEADDFAVLPNLAVVRGFIRAYAKVLKLDAAPLVAMIEVDLPVRQETPLRRERPTSFAESRFPSMTTRSSSRVSWVVAGVVVLVVAAVLGAYRFGLIPPAMLKRADQEIASATQGAPAASDSHAAAPLQSASVPLISVPSPTGAPPAAAPPAPLPAAPAPSPAAAPAAAPAADATAPAGVTGKLLVLKVTQDSWIQINRPDAPPLVARLVRAGSTETFDLKGSALLIVGNPAGVEATLQGAPLDLPPVPGKTLSHVRIK